MTSCKHNLWFRVLQYYLGHINKWWCGQKSLWCLFEIFGMNFGSDQFILFEMKFTETLLPSSAFNFFLFPRRILELATFLEKKFWIKNLKNTNNPLWVKKKNMKRRRFHVQVWIIPWKGPKWVRDVPSIDLCLWLQCNRYIDVGDGYYRWFMLMTTWRFW